MRKRIAIIGAGPAGLASGKACLEEGLKPIIFEKSSAVGGVWSKGHSGLTWQGMQTNLSKWSCMFSDFPWCDDIGDFPDGQQVAEYLERYADHFGMRNFIQLNNPVLSVSQHKKKWVVRTAQGEQEFDYVVVASGFFSKASMPDIDGAQHFEGKILHSSAVRSVDDIAEEHKNIVVCGGSFSGYELAAEFSRQSENPVTHVLDRPAWILERYFPSKNGLVPNDLASYSREKALAVKNHGPVKKRQESIDFFKESFGNPGNVCSSLRVDENPVDPLFVVISDSYLEQVLAERIIPIRGRVNNLFSDSIGITVTDKIKADFMVMATGYKAILPFLDSSVRDKICYQENNPLMPALLEEAVWPLGVHDLAFVGFYRGPYFAIIELQARWVAGVFSGRLPNPSPEEKLAGVQQCSQIRSMYPRPQFPFPEYVSFADRLARKVGCYPNLHKTDDLFKVLKSGPFLPAHYRISGFGKNRMVAENIINSVPYCK